MSLVANVLLTCSLLEDTDPDERPIPIREVNEAIGFLHPKRSDLQAKQVFKPIWEYAGGYKAFERDLWACAFNHFSVGEILMCVAAANWRYPDEVQILIAEQEDDGFRIEGIA